LSSSVRIVWRPAPGIVLRADDSALLVEAPPRPTAQVPIGDPCVAAILARLGRGLDAAAMSQAVEAGGGDPAVLARNLGLMRGAGLLVAQIVAGDTVHATIFPYAREFDVPLPRPATRTQYRLSRFVMLRPSEQGWLLEHPEASCVVIVRHDDLWQALYALPRPGTAIESGTIDEIFDVLAQLGFLLTGDITEAPEQRSWEFHDRWFQRRTRLFDDFLPQGSTYRFARAFPSPEAIRPPHLGIEVPLPPPATRAGRGLYEVIEQRRSRREMADEPLSLLQVGELLHRSARIIEHVPATPQETLRRPFPSGGGIHELEFYLVAGRCEGLDPGLYHYTAAHSLLRLMSPATLAEAMLQGCAGAWGQPNDPPQAMIVIASRLPRLAWKYQGIAYRLSLLNAGVALQTLSLVCEELGLSGAIAGSGDPRLFAAASGLSTWEEPSIAEFGFGRRRAE